MSPELGRILDVGGRYVAATAIIQGDVEIGAGANIWHHVSIRGDVAPIRIGARVNIQDGCMLHCEHGVMMEIGDAVILGHHAVAHCRRIGPRTLVGTGSVVLDGVEIGEGCLIAAGSVVSPGTRVPDGSVALGTPAKVAREVRPIEREYMDDVVRRYVALAQRHVAGEFPDWGAGRA